MYIVFQHYLCVCMNMCTNMCAHMYVYVCISMYAYTCVGVCMGALVCLCLICVCTCASAHDSTEIVIQMISFV